MRVILMKTKLQITDPTFNSTFFKRPLETFSMLRERTRRLWIEKNPGVPFDADETTPTSPTEEESTPSQLSYDIKSAAVRQGTFYYQVSTVMFS